MGVGGNRTINSNPHCPAIRTEFTCQADEMHKRCNKRDGTLYAPRNKLAEDGAQSGKIAPYARGLY